MQYDMTTVAAAQGVYPNDPPTFTSDAAEAKITVDGQQVSAMPAGALYEVWVKVDAVDSAKAAVTVRGRANNQSYLLRSTVHQATTPAQNPNNQGVSTIDPTTLLTPPPHTDPPEDWILSGMTPLQKAAGTYVIRNLYASGTANLIFDGDAVVWVEGNISCSGDGIINPDGAPAVPQAERHTVIFYVVGEGVTITLMGSSEFNAFIYAPFTSISVQGSADVFGGLAGTSVTISGSATSTANPVGEDLGFPVSAQTAWLLDLWGQ
jgi:hypothetical protein